MTPDESVNRFLGKTLQAEIDIFRAENRHDVADAVARHLVPRTLAAFERELHPVNGMRELLTGLSGVPRAVASGSTPDRLALSLRVTGLAPFFDPHIYSSTLVANPKPAPDLFLYAAARLNVDARSCTVVEDAVGGVRAGVAAGMRVIGFLGGSHTTPAHADRLLEAGAAAVAPDAGALRTMLMR